MHGDELLGVLLKALPLAVDVGLGVLGELLGLGLRVREDALRLLPGGLRRLPVLGLGGLGQLAGLGLRVGEDVLRLPLGLFQDVLALALDLPQLLLDPEGVDPGVLRRPSPSSATGPRASRAAGRSPPAGRTRSAAAHR